MQIRISAQALIIQDETLLVIVKPDDKGELYSLPGGGQEFGETLVEALQRECLEELGARVVVNHFVTVREFISKNHANRLDDKIEHIVNHIFACTLLEPPATPLNPDLGQTGVRWLPVSHLEQFRFYPQTLAALLANDQPIPFYLGDVN
jgi:8-oxo-dGTP diphosphatase